MSLASDWKKNNKSYTEVAKVKSRIKLCLIVVNKKILLSYVPDSI